MAEQTYYSCAQLAALALPGYPGSERRFRDLVEREGWVYHEEKSRGRSGLTRRYLPPERVAKLIANKDLIPMRFMGDSDEVTLTLTVSIEQARKILTLLRRSRRG